MKTYIRMTLILFVVSNIVLTVRGQNINIPFSDVIAIPLKESGFVRVKSSVKINEIPLYFPNTMNVTILKDERKNMSSGVNITLRESLQFPSNNNYYSLNNSMTGSVVNFSVVSLRGGGGIMPFSDPYEPGDILDPTNVTPQGLRSLPVGNGLVLISFAFTYIVFIIFRKRKKILLDSNK